MEGLHCQIGDPETFHSGEVINRGNAFSITEDGSGFQWVYCKYISRM